MAFWRRSPDTARGAGPGDNAVVATASSGADRLAAVAAHLDTLLPGAYVIFANASNPADYVQFVRNRDGTLVMEVASGNYGEPSTQKLADSALAVTTLNSLGLSLVPGKNFIDEDVSAGASSVANWVEGVFINLFRADDDFTLEVLTAPASTA